MSGQVSPNTEMFGLVYGENNSIQENLQSLTRSARCVQLLKHHQHTGVVNCVAPFLCRALERRAASMFPCFKLTQDKRNDQKLHEATLAR